MSNCVFCKSEFVKIIQKVNRIEIIELYSEELKINVSNEFKNFEFFNIVECQKCKLLFFNPQLVGSESFYEELQSLESNYYSLNRPEFDFALDFIAKDDSVLEIGSGSAIFAQKLKVNKYIGLEYNDRAIVEAQKKGISLIKDNIKSFVNNHNISFNVVCSFHVIEHVKNPEEFIKYSIKALKKGGKVIIAVPCADSYLTKNVNHVLNIIPHHISRWKIESLKFISKKYGLEIIKIEVDKVNNRSQYFVYKYSYLINKFLFPKKTIINNSKSYKVIFKIVRKINEIFNIYRWENKKKYYGKNMMIILEN